MLEFPDGTVRMVTSHTGSAVEISGPYRYAAAGQTVTLYPGCDKRRSTCLDKFDNLLNQGGFAWIPSRGIMNGTSIT